MITYKTSNFVSYKDKVSESILSWSLGREKALNVIAVPYSSPIIFLKIILNYIENGKKVLYITGESEDNIQILSLIKKYLSPSLIDFQHFLDIFHLTKL